MAYLNDEMIEKKWFVETELADMLHRATGGFVRRCQYLHPSGGCEIVRVCFGDSSYRDVNVAGDSRWAIAKDVMKAVAGRYE